MNKVMGIFHAAALLCFWLMASFVVAAPPGGQPQQTTPVQSTSQFSEQQPLVSMTDSRPERFMLHIGDRFIGVGETGMIFTEATVKMSAMVLLCGCINRPVWVKFDVDGQTIHEHQLTPPGSYNPSAPPLCCQNIM